jgi:hypothetical protein
LRVAIGEAERSFEGGASAVDFDLLFDRCFGGKRRRDGNGAKSITSSILIRNLPHDDED